jgi:TPR repeat protein
LKLIQQAADNNDRVGLRMMGEAYVSGNGVNRDYAKAIGFLSLAVQQREPDSYHLLARLYWKGLGVKSDFPKSLDLLKQGVALGDSWSQYYLGQYYEHSGNEALALKLYLGSANQGNRKAAYAVGLHYAEGKGLEKDHTKAFTYFKVSATKGDKLAQREMAWASEFGLGTAVNLVTAYYWYSLAKAGNDQFSTNRLPLLMAKMNQDELRAGEAAVAAWEQRRVERFQGR